MKLSYATIRFRLWQLRRGDPEITQIAAAEEIGIDRDTLRAACPSGWKWGGAREVFNTIPSVDAFFESEQQQRRFLIERGL